MKEMLFLNGQLIFIERWTPSAAGNLNIFTWKSQEYHVLNAPTIPFNSRPSFLLRGNNFH